MITVHHLENSRSQRILWLLEELGLEYEVERYDRDPKTMLAPDSLKQVHPLGKSPIITDTIDDDTTHTIAETGAIIEYLVAKAGGKLAPSPDSEERLRYTYWLHYAEGTFMPLVVMKLIFGRLGSAPMPLPMRPFGKAIGFGVQKQFLAPRIEENLNFLEAELNERMWFAGNDFTAADVMMSFPLEAAAAGDGLKESHPRLGQFLERIHARSAYQMALERGGPYELIS